MTGKSFGELASAMQLRDFVKKVVSRQIKEERPKPRYAEVIAINYTTMKCTIQYVGDSTTVDVKMGAIQPAKTGLVVRVEGKSPDKYITDVYGPVRVLGGIPIGVHFPYGNATPPQDYLLCDGSEILRLSPLGLVISTSYGVGNGTTTCNLPNFNAGAGDTQRFPLGGVGIGGKGGVASHSHTAGSLAGVSHSHGVASIGAHSHGLAITGAAMVTFGTGLQMNRINGFSWVANEQATTATASTSTAGQANAAGLIGSTNNGGLSGTTDGSGNAISGSTDAAAFYPPWQGSTYIIKYQ